jgi:hypothetical protein
MIVREAHKQAGITQLACYLTLIWHRIGGVDRSRRGLRRSSIQACVTERVAEFDLPASIPIVQCRPPFVGRQYEPLVGTPLANDHRSGPHIRATGICIISFNLPIRYPKCRHMAVEGALGTVVVEVDRAYAGRQRCGHDRRIIMFEAENVAKLVHQCGQEIDVTVRLRSG